VNSSGVLESTGTFLYQNVFDVAFKTRFVVTF